MLKKRIYSHSFSFGAVIFILGLLTFVSGSTALAQQTLPTPSNSPTNCNETATISGTTFTGASTIGEQFTPQPLAGVKIYHIATRNSDGKLSANYTWDDISKLSASQKVLIATSDSNGNYSATFPLFNWQTDNYESFYAEKQGYSDILRHPAITTMKVTDCQNVKHNFQLTQGINNILTGTVRDKNHTPLPREMVALVKNGIPVYSGYTDSNGEYEISTILAGTYDVKDIFNRDVQAPEFSTTIPPQISVTFSSNAGETKELDIVVDRTLDTKATETITVYKTLENSGAFRGPTYPGLTIKLYDDPNLKTVDDVKAAKPIGQGTSPSYTFNNLTIRNTPYVAAVFDSTNQLLRASLVPITAPRNYNDLYIQVTPSCKRSDMTNLHVYFCGDQAINMYNNPTIYGSYWTKLDQTEGAMASLYGTPKVPSDLVIMTSSTYQAMFDGIGAGANNSCPANPPANQLFKDDYVEISTALIKRLSADQVTDVYAHEKGHANSYKAAGCKAPTISEQSPFVDIYTNASSFGQDFYALIKDSTYDPSFPLGGHPSKGTSDPLGAIFGSGRVGSPEEGFASITHADYKHADAFQANIDAIAQKQPALKPLVEALRGYTRSLPNQ